MSFGLSQTPLITRLTGFVCLCSVLIASISFFPLSWLGHAFINPRVPYSLAYQGTVWNGTLSGIPNIAPVTFQTSPVKALTGQDALSFQSRSPQLEFAGRLGIKHLEEFTLQGHASYLGVIDGRLGNLSGIFAMNITEAHFNAGCERATGSTTSDILAQNAHIWYWQGPSLSGPVTCEDGALSLTLSGKDPSTDVNAHIAIRLDGTYRIQIDLASTDPRTDAVLPLYGFQKTQTGYRLSEAGKWS